MNLPQVYMCSPSRTLPSPPSRYHPSGSSQCTSPKHPVSCIEPGLVTRFIYDIIHISMPFSQIIPPSPSPTESKRLFYTFRIFLSNVTSDTGSNFPTFVLTHFGIMVILTLYDEVIFFCVYVQEECIRDAIWLQNVWSQNILHFPISNSCGIFPPHLRCTCWMSDDSCSFLSAKRGKLTRKFMHLYCTHFI